jgi:hypothetical protein
LIGKITSTLHSGMRHFPLLCVFSLILLIHSGFIKAMGAASFGKVDEHGHHLPATPSPSVSRPNSSVGNHSGAGTPDERKSRFGSRKGNGGGK